MILSGKNLGERQKDLNSKVNDAVAKKVNFDTIKEQKEVSDVDVLFKIDVAAAYKNTEYILEILKSEDTLHITRALKKCDWLFDDEHSYIINIYYLHHNIFPHMSMKMKRKMLRTISTHVKDETQAETFYNYCRTEKLYKIAKKFLLYTSEDFKIRYIKKLVDAAKCYKKGNLKFFLGNSFTLAEAYIEKVNKYMRANCLIDISYLYSESNEKYLDLLEKYLLKYNNFIKFGKKFTKDIAKKHKNRVLANLEIYLDILDMKTLVKHSNLEEIKQYAAAELSEPSESFWIAKYWKNNKLLLNAIPAKERFDFVKEIFTKKNPGENFETCDEFYTKGYYNLMTRKQKIEATKDYANETGNISRIKRNIWYRNVDFDTAFSTFEEKMLNNKKRKIRTNLLIVLIKASKSQQNLLKVLNYYQAIFNKEKVLQKEKILNTIILHHQVFELNAKCWAVLEKMLMDDEICRKHSYPEKKYVSIVYLYRILHDKQFPGNHRDFFDNTRHSSFSEGLKKMNKKQRKMTLEYLLQYHVNRLYEYDDTDYDFDKMVKEKIRRHVHAVINLIKGLEKSKEDIPEIAQKYILYDWEQYRFYDELKDDQNNFMKRLKRDASTVQHFKAIQENLENNWDLDFNYLPVLRKIKIYFSNDIAPTFLAFFQFCISERNLEDDDYRRNLYRLINTAIIGIYMLADESYKQELMLHFKPVTNKIREMEEMDDVYLNIQEAVCRYGYYSRPPLPISSLTIYLRGDYTKLILPTISSLFANLSRTSCIQLAETVLTAPGSKLKFSFHLLLNYLSIDDLQEMIIPIVKNTKDSSLRKDLFALMYRAILRYSDDSRRNNLFECFKEMASNLPEYDENIYNTLKNMKKPLRFYVDKRIAQQLLAAYQKYAPSASPDTEDSFSSDINSMEIVHYC